MFSKSWIDKFLSPLGASASRGPKSRKAGPSQPRRQRLWFEVLEGRSLLAAVVVTNSTDVTDGTTTSIADLIAHPGADGKIRLARGHSGQQQDTAAPTASRSILVKSSWTCTSCSPRDNWRSSMP